MPTSYRIGVTRRGQHRGQPLRHALGPAPKGRPFYRAALCDAWADEVLPGTWSPDHPRACPKCRRIIDKREENARGDQ